MILFSFWFWCERFKFDVSNLNLMWAICFWCEQFVFDVSNLFLLWSFYYCRCTCRPPYPGVSNLPTTFVGGRGGSLQEMTVIGAGGRRFLSTTEAASRRLTLTVLSKFWTGAQGFKHSHVVFRQEGLHLVSVKLLLPPTFRPNIKVNHFHDKRNPCSVINVNPFGSQSETLWLPKWKTLDSQSETLWLPKWKTLDSQSENLGSAKFSNFWF